MIRQATVAGSFYPANPQELEDTIRDFLDHAKKDIPVPKAIISPHAGYMYSGPIAANAYATLKNAANVINRVVLVGASHHFDLNIVAISSAENFATPFGLVKIDQSATKIISSLQSVGISDEAHENEHTLEVQLPFLQMLLKEFTIVPLLVNSVPYKQVANVIEALWGGAETLVVISSDLSHYFSYSKAQQLDQQTANAIKNLQPENIHEIQACGSLPIKSILEVAIRKRLKPSVIDLRNSGDTSENKDRVVGYGAFHFYEQAIL